MKKLMMSMLAMCLMLSMSVFAIDKKASGSKKMEKAKEVTVVGIVTDPMCAKSGDKTKMMDSDCAKKCAKDGKLALVNDADGKVWAIENGGAVKGHEGHHVKVTGHPNAEKMSFHVMTVSMDTSNMGKHKGEMKHDAHDKAMDKAKEISVVGIVTDPMCAKSGDKAKMTNADCVKKCAADGKLAFVNDADGKVWAIENGGAVKGHEGHHVKLVGHANSEKMSFHVMTVSMDTGAMAK
ncbi:MAG TPA: hypothetical protein VM056_04125 [Terriglobales bacterium]|nr:hypothetical protein [Terriglobales bacterium]